MFFKNIVWTSKSDKNILHALLSLIIPYRSLVSKMMQFGAYCLAVIGLSGFSWAQRTGDRVISLDNKPYNGTTQVEMRSQSLGQADFFKLNPGPNATTFDSWVTLHLQTAALITVLIITLDGTSMR